MLRLSLVVFCFLPVYTALAQANGSVIDSSWIHGDIRITRDLPAHIFPKKRTLIILYALPNGNSTEQTMGKKVNPGDDWHFDIQHIRAQTSFLRNSVKDKNIVVIYLENKYRSWPRWKQLHPDFKMGIISLVDSLFNNFPAHKKELHLNGHSGGGSFIFGYLAGITKIPGFIKRITFIDSNYGYDSSYYPVIRNWLLAPGNPVLNIFSYNDSIALYNGKPLVSSTGGTWYRSYLMLKHLNNDFQIYQEESDSMYIIKEKNKRFYFYLKKNIDRGIYHTQQVELNGFIHSVLIGTKYEFRGYKYYRKRAYEKYIL